MPVLGNAFGSMRRLEIGLEMTDFTEIGQRITDMTKMDMPSGILNKIKKSGDEIIYRDLDDEMLFVSGLTESGMNIDEADQTEYHKKMFELYNESNILSIYPII